MCEHMVLPCAEVYYSFMQQNVFPVEYGPDFDTALETLVSEFFTRLEELLPIPDFKQV